MEITIEELRALTCPSLAPIATNPNGRTHSIRVGEAYFVRTVTMHYTGRVESITDCDIVLTKAAWIADSGRFSEALKTGLLSEIEPFPSTVIIGRDAIIDISPWKHDLPEEVK